MSSGLLARRSIRLCPASSLRVPPLAVRSLHALTRPTSLQQSNAQSQSRSLATALSPEGSAVPKDSVFAPLDTFTRRHIGPQPASINKMLETLGFKDLDEFIGQCVPPSIRLSSDVLSEEGPNAIKPLSEQELLRRAYELGQKNKVFKSFIGMGIV